MEFVNRALRKNEKILGNVNRALKFGWEVLVRIGDRLPFDLVLLSITSYQNSSEECLV